MKKILSIIFSAAVAFTLASCTQQEKIIVSTGQSEAPVILSSNVGDDITLNYTPAKIIINGETVKNSLVKNVVAIVKVADQDVDLALSTKDDQEACALTVKGTAVTNALKGLGHEEGETLDLVMVMRSQMSETANTGWLVSNETINTPWTIKAPAGNNPYASWDPSEWGVTGSIASTGNNWGNSDDPDITMVTDGTWHVAYAVKLTPTDEFKFRKDSQWTVNLGGDFVAIDEEFAVSQGGPNIKVAEEGTYDLFVNPEALVAKIIVTGSNSGSAIPDVDLSGYEVNEAMAGATTWGLIGPAQPGGWDVDTDLEKVSDDPEIWCVKDIELAGDKFKFRGNDEWKDYDLGGGTVALDTIIELSKGGGDMAIEAGTYTVYLFPTYMVCYITK